MRIPFDFIEAIPHGLTSSPDGSKIAFTRGPNLWIYSVPTGECLQQTAYPDWPAEGGNIQVLRVIGWTEQGGLIVTVQWGESGPGDGEPPPVIMPLDGCKKVVKKETPNPALEFNESASYLIDPKSKELKPAPSNWTYIGQRPSGWIRLSPAPELPDWATGNEYQLFIPESGKKVITVKTNGTEMSQIMTIDTKTKEISEASPKGPFAKYQWPSFSPNEKRIAYKVATEQGHGPVYVDGSPVMPDFNVIKYWWIDDDTIAADSFNRKLNRFEIRIVRLSDGKVLGEYSQPR